jgi:hypothetical protein
LAFVLRFAMGVQRKNVICVCWKAADFERGVQWTRGGETKV